MWGSTSVQTEIMSWTDMHFPHFSSVVNFDSFWDSGPAHDVNSSVQELRGAIRHHFFLKIKTSKHWSGLIWKQLRLIFTIKLLTLQQILNFRFSVKLFEEASLTVHFIFRASIAIWRTNMKHMKTIVSVGNQMTLIVLWGYTYVKAFKHVKRLPILKLYISQILKHWILNCKKRKEQLQQERNCTEYRQYRRSLRGVS